MYGQNLGGRPDTPGEPIFTKFCMRVCVPDMFLSFEFQKDRMKNVGAVGGRNFDPPIEKAHRLYNSLLLPHKPWCSSWAQKYSSFEYLYSYSQKVAIFAGENRKIALQLPRFPLERL